MNPYSIFRSLKLIALPLTVGLGLMVMSSGTPVHADYNEGARAYANKDYSAAIKAWSAPEMAEDPRALFALGVIYIRGIGTEQDRSKGIDYYQRSADRGFASAQFNLGLAWYAGKGVAADPGKALGWWQMAAEQDHAVAQYNLGAILWSGDGVPKNQARGMHWFRRAKANGSRDASNFLLTLYAPMYRELNAESMDLARQNSRRKIPLIDEFGMYKLGEQAVEQKEFGQAFGYWQPLAQDGHIDSQYQIARLFEFGLGIEKNFDQAIDWYQRAAQKGQGDAQYRIGLYHINENPDPNKALGLYWMQSAADNDSEEAAKYIRSQ